MKTLKIFTCYFLFALSLFILTVYQSCKQKSRQCSIISSMQGVYFNDAIHHALPDSAEIKADDFGIALSFLKSDYQCSNVNYSFVNHAYAIMARGQLTNYVDTVKSILITSNQDFDLTHPAGSSLNEYFTIPDLGQFYFPNNYVYQDFGFDLLLHQTPANTGLYHQFTVSATLQSRNEPLAYTFEHVKLIP